MKNRKNKDNTAGGYAPAHPTRLSLLLHFLAGSASFFLAGVVSAALAGLFDLLHPKIIAWAVDRLDTQSAAEAAGLIILVTCLGALFRYLYRLFNAKGAEKLVEQMRNEALRPHRAPPVFLVHGKCDRRRDSALHIGRGDGEELSLRAADRILAVRDGHIVESGTHAELMAARGYYYRLYTWQYEGEETAKAL